MPKHNPETTTWPILPLCSADMAELKLQDGDHPLRGYPTYYCPETGELYPLPHDCDLFFRTRP